ncbi:hypothetical protein FV232_22710 [Methylobacterium sp. WL30]|uniref:hypothetical protein n=1 Tax=Methylobacterium sp. WL30 TaxID=2603895 RepID=UPI0011CB8DAE|nr:hypothetical protein [Methylobacterium sp. WL30]TXN63678.1 hypothetical protein FV232_22710 [Methylobacterium sp. WL30]
MQYFLTNPAAVRAACLVEHLDADPLGVRMATPAGSPVVVLAAPWIRRRLLEPARPAHGPVLEAPEAEENTPSATPPRGKGAGATAAEADHGRSGQTTLAGPIEPRRLVLQHNDVWAHALALDGSVTIRAGSEIRKTAYATMSPGIVQARQTCCDEHALVDMPGDTTRWRLVRDVVVPSATFAVRFVTGCHLDGRAWQPLA